MGKHARALKIFIIILFIYVADYKNNVQCEESLQSTKKYAWHRKGETTTTEKTNHILKMTTPCTTPNFDSGYCMNIEECPLLWKKWQETSLNSEFVKASFCHPPNAQNYKVCCGRHDDFQKAHLSSSTKHTITEPKNPLPKTCGLQNVTIKGRIFGGTEASLGEFPWMVRLFHKNRFGYKTPGCSGFLIHSKYVMTAAHCIKSANNAILGNVFEVQLGEHNTDTAIDCAPKNGTCAEPPKKIRILETIVHNYYDENSTQHHHDIALIHLKKGAKYSKYIYPICLMEEYRNFEPFEYWISGWGKTKTRDASNIKMKVSIPPFSYNACHSRYSNIDVVITRKQICAGGKINEDSCTGDSGGPLMIAQDGNHWFAAGVVSFGLGCGKENWPGIYTNVTSYIDWVKNTIIEKSAKSQSQIKTRSGKIGRLHK